MSGSVHVQISNGKVDPILPDALSKYMTEEEWQELCYAVDDAFSPAVRYNERYSTLRAIFIVTGLIGLLSVWIGPGPFGILLVAAGAAAITAATSIGYGLHRYWFLADNVEARVDQVLRDFSLNSKAGLTLRLLKEKEKKRKQGTKHFIRVDYALRISLVQERAGYRLSPTSGRT